MKRRFLPLALAGLLAWAAGPATAQQGIDDWPQRPVRLIVPFAAGGATDGLSRLLAQRLQALWKQPVVIENKAGAGTVLGTDTVAKAAPDGYTLGAVITAFTINPTLRPRLPYDTLRDLVPVTQVASQQLVLAAHPDFPADNVADLIPPGQAKPGGISYASPGSGTAMHLATEMINVKAGVQLVHVPYRGGAPAQQDVVGGQLPLLLDVYYSTAPLIRAGKLKTLALLGERRDPTLPDIPVVAETVPGVSANSFLGLVAPRGTPPALVERIARDVKQLVSSADFGTQLREYGMEPIGSTPAEFAQLIRSEIDKWAPIVRQSGATAD